LLPSEDKKSAKVKLRHNDCDRESTSRERV
jgi:hypothetical protein